jgi:hypothetical protein
VPGRARVSPRQSPSSAIRASISPVWEHSGTICTGETYKKAVKLTFANGASLDDPTGLFNSSLDGNVRRAIDIHDGEDIDAGALEDLIRTAVALNESK